jgi:predicted nucleic acid-binding protein
MTAAGPAIAITAEALIERAQTQPVRLLLDTNVLFSHRELGKISTDVNRLNASGGMHISLFVSAVVHAEKLFDLRQEHGASYDPADVLRAMRARGLKVLAFKARHADHTAELLAHSFPTGDAWREAKRKRCVDCLGLRHDGASTPGKGTTCSATVDWLIAGHALAKRCILVTDDRGTEFRLAIERVRLDTLKQALGRMLAQTAAGSGQP